LKGTFHLIAVILGIAASLLAVLAVATYEGYIPLGDVDNLTSTELGTLSALAVVGAIGAAYAEREM
jgi:hypothetical protein